MKLCVCELIFLVLERRDEDAGNLKGFEGILLDTYPDCKWTNEKWEYSKQSASKISFNLKQLIGFFE